MRESVVAADMESADLRMAAIPENVTSAATCLPDGDPSGYLSCGGRMPQGKMRRDGGGLWTSRLEVRDERVPDKDDLPRALLLLRGASDPRSPRRAGRTGRRRRRDLGDKRLQGYDGTSYQRRVRRKDATRPRHRVPRGARQGGLERPALPTPREGPRRLSHAPRPPPP